MYRTVFIILISCVLKGYLQLCIAYVLNAAIRGCECGGRVTSEAPAICQMSRGIVSPSLSGYDLSVRWQQRADIISNIPGVIVSSSFGQSTKSCFRKVICAYRIESDEKFQIRKSIVVCMFQRNIVHISGIFSTKSLQASRVIYASLVY